MSKLYQIYEVLLKNDSDLVLCRDCKSVRFVHIDVIFLNHERKRRNVSRKILFYHRCPLINDVCDNSNNISKESS